MQSYGSNSHFEIRHTDPHPSKSAVVGMIAAAMGIRREEEERFLPLNTLKFAVRIDQIGRMISDYQTAAKYKSSGEFDRTYVTKRYYLEEAVFLVAVEGEDALIDEAWLCLQYPYFPIFYGRRSCPVSYDFLVGVYEGDAMRQMQDQPWMAAAWYQKGIKEEKVGLDIYTDQDYLSQGRERYLRRDHPTSFSQLGRKHEYRFEVHGQVYIDNKNYRRPADQGTDHDAFAALDEESDVSE